MLPHLLEAAIHQRWRNPFTVPVSRYVQPLNLTRSLAENAIWRLRPTELGKPHQPGFILSQQGYHVGVGYFSCLNSLAVTGLTVQIHILGRIQGAKGCPECLFSKL